MNTDLIVLTAIISTLFCVFIFGPLFYTFTTNKRLPKESESENSAETKVDAPKS